LDVTVRIDSLLKLVRGYTTGKPLRGMSTSDILSYYTDGYLAKFYTRAALSELLVRNGCEVSKVFKLGQTSELVPIPGIGLLGDLKRMFVSRLPDRFVEYVLRSLGSFLFAIATKPHPANSEQ
jgi:hypothetical protein